MDRRMHPHVLSDRSPLTSTRWKPWLAVVMTLIGGSIGLMFLGRIRRGILWCCMHQAWHWIYVLWIVYGRPNRLIFCGLLIFFPVLWLARVLDTYTIACKPISEPRRWYQRWYLYLAALLVGMIAWDMFIELNHAYFSDVFLVPMRAMAKTVLPEDRIIVTKSPSNPIGVEHGDIVVFRTGSLEKPTLVTMRVVGLPGDRLRMEDRQLYRNGKAVDESAYAYYSGPSRSMKLDSFPETTVPEETYFVLGDNRNLAKDSRIHGPVSFQLHYGSAVYVYWSIFQSMSDAPEKPQITTGPLRWDRIGLPLK